MIDYPQIRAGLITALAPLLDHNLVKGFRVDSNERVSVKDLPVIDIEFGPEVEIEDHRTFRSQDFLISVALQVHTPVTHPQEQLDSIASAVHENVNADSTLQGRVITARVLSKEQEPNEEKEFITTNIELELLVTVRK